MAKYPEATNRQAPAFCIKCFSFGVKKILFHKTNNTKMDWKILLLSFSVVFALNSCGGGSQNQAADGQTAEEPVTPEMEEQNKLWAEVMRVHDEIMPKMSDINRLSREIKLKMENNGQIEQGLIAEMHATLQRLAKADEDMWAWMHNLQQLPELRKTKSHEEILNYLEQERVAIEDVKKTMTESIQMGEKVLTVLETGGKE
jgi:hypothetical protein